MASKQNESGNKGSQRGGSGNFANDPERASEAGKKGGEHSHGGGRSGGSGGSGGGSSGGRGGSSGGSSGGRGSSDE